MNTALRRWQRSFAAAVTAPVAPGAKARAALRIATGGALGTSARLHIYRFAYRERLLGLLADEFPALKRLLGERAFRALAAAYVAGCPSRHPNLNRFAMRLPGYLARTRLPVAHRAFAVALARLEAARSAAALADEQAVLPPAALTEVPPTHLGRVRLQLHPSVQLMALRVPPGAWYAAHGAGRRARLPAPRQCWMLVHRHGYVVRWMELARGEYGVLRALAAGASLARALQRAQPSDPVADWFRRWGAAGLFTGIR